MAPHQGGKGAGNRGLRRWSEVSEPSERSTGSGEKLLKFEILLCRAREAWNERKGMKGWEARDGVVFLSLYEDKNEWIFLLSSLVNTLLGYVNSTIHMNLYLLAPISIQKATFSDIPCRNSTHFWLIGKKFCNGCLWEHFPVMLWTGNSDWTKKIVS